MMKRTIITLFFSLLCGVGYSSNYTLNIINIDEVGANNRILFAYPAIEYRVRIAAFGGTYPFTWTLGTHPDGMTINADTGEITWASPTATGSPHTVQVTVTDAENSTDTESYTVTVTNSTSRFIWMDASTVEAQGSRTGAYDHPYKDFDDWYTLGSGSHGGQIMYLRDGTYDFSGIAGENHRGHGSYAVFFDGSYHPTAYIAYPGETPVIDLTRSFSGTNSGKEISWWSNNDDLYYYGITFQSIYAHAFDLYGSDCSVWHSCIFDDANDLDAYYENDAYIFWREGGTCTKHAVLGCTLGDTSGTYISGLKMYDAEYFVIEGNTFDDIVESCINPKDSVNYVSIRNNSFSNSSFALRAASYGTGVSNIDFTFNYVGPGQDIWFESEYGLIGPVHFERNTIVSDIQIRDLVAEDGIYYFLNNVIVNTESTSDGDAGDHIYNRHDGPDNRISECHNGDTNCNIVATSATGLVDSNGGLIGDWAQYIGTKGWETGDEGEDTTDPAPPTLSNVTISGGSFR